MSEPKKLTAIIDDLQAKLDACTESPTPWFACVEGELSDNKPWMVHVDFMYTMASNIPQADAEVIAASINGLRAMLEVARGLANECEATPFVNQAEVAAACVRNMLTPYCQQFNVPIDGK